MAYLGFESGGTKLVVTLSINGSDIVESRVIKRPHDAQALDSLQALMQTGQALLRDHQISDLAAIGFGFGGNVNQLLNQPSLCMHEAGWESLSAREVLEEAFSVPVYVLNDCDAAALAEAKAELNRNVQHFYYVTLGTGVGGAFYTNGDIFHTSPAGNAEIGHIMVDESGNIACPCGNKGCLEAVCSGPGLLQLSKLLYPRAGISRAEEVTQGYVENDEACIAIMDKYTEYLGKGMAAVITLFHPERIILGGGLGSFVSTVLHDKLIRIVEARCYPLFRGSVSIHPWQVCEGAVSLGAIFYAKQQLMERS
ncbi:ROK family protein [Paenibacillus chungangensis]|uniref:ROK family protein n=1 Tax=Paenibacillus chungangensis TaxID=696535 RepID=A0ABW3HUB8_9BACL